MRRVALVTGPLTPLTENFKKVRFGDPDESARILTYGREPWGVVESVKLAYVSSVGANVWVAAFPRPTLDERPTTNTAATANRPSRSNRRRTGLLVFMHRARGRSHRVGECRLVVSVANTECHT